MLQVEDGQSADLEVKADRASAQKNDEIKEDWLGGPLLTESVRKLGPMLLDK